MKQTIQWKNKSIQIDIGLILILILFGMTSCFAREFDTPFHN